MTGQITPVAGPPSEKEISNRIVAVQSKMKEHGLDFYLCFSPDNIFYLTNFANFVHERPFILLVPAKGTPIFLMPKLEEPHVRMRSVGEVEFLNYFEFPAPEGRQWFDKMKTILSPEHRVGIETLCPFAVAREVPGSTTAIDIVEDVRMIKSEYEIGRIAYTCGLLNKGHARLLAGARPGRMIIELYSKANSAMTKKMLMDNPNSNMLNSKFAVIAQPPGISHDPHNFTDVFMKFSEGGPHVSLASGLANGYGGEVERTFFINSVPEKCKRPFHDMIEGRALAYDLTVPGNLMSEVDRKVNELFKKKGYGPNLLHRTGHSFGVTNHEAPFLAEGYAHEIKPSMVFSIEPGFYIKGLGGFRFSDTVLITEKGNQKLTDAPETVKELTVDGKPSFTDTAKSLIIKLLSKGSAG
jgi:Xaa-Pro dipeptidase